MFPSRNLRIARRGYQKSGSGAFVIAIDLLAWMKLLMTEVYKCIYVYNVHFPPVSVLAELAKSLYSSLIESVTVRIFPALWM